MKLNTAILDSKSGIYLYVLEQNKTDVLQKLLITDLIFLVNGYDKNIYESSRNIKKTLCEDYPLYHKPLLKEYLNTYYFKTDEGKVEKEKVVNNLKKIENELCINNSQTD